MNLPTSQWTFDPSANYLPSLLLCYTLVFWSASCLFIEIATMTYLPLIYAFTTYMPIFYFALQSIRAHARRLYADPEYFRISSRWAISLACIWCLTMATHAYIWWSATMCQDMFLGPLYATFQPAFIMIYIASRYLIHGRHIRPGITLGSSDEEIASNIAIHTDDLAESPPHQEGNVARNSNNTTIRDDSTFDHPEDVTNSTTSSQVAVFEPYTPSISLLLVSIALITSTILFEILKDNTGNGNLIVVASLLQVCISLVSLQLYTIFQTVRKHAITYDLSMIPNVTLELTVLWLSTRFITTLPSMLQRKCYWWSILGVTEAGLLLYFSVRYTFSLRKADKYHDQRIIDNDPTSDTTTSIPPNDPMIVFQPPNYLLAGCIILSILSIGLWAIHGFFILNFSILAYVPTIIVYAYSIFQTRRPSHADGRRYVKAAEWSVEISVLWTATYGPNIFIWWGVRGSDWRWLPYFAVMYIAIRYIWDADARENQHKGVSLPPDDSEVESVPS